MVKGVSKTIIEVNNTGSKLFEKIVFYVTPEYGNLSAKQLKRAAGNFCFNYQKSPKKIPLRKYYKRRRNLMILGSSILVFAALGTILLFLL